MSGERHDIERIAPGAPDAIGALLERRELPLVIAGGARGWPAFARWSPSYLKDKVGRVAIRCKLSSSEVHPDFHQTTLAAMFARRATTLADLIDHVTTAPADQRARWLFTGDEQFVLQRRDGTTTVDGALGLLLDDAPCPPFVPAHRLYTVWAWLSGRGVRTWLHYDNNGCHNLNAQILGTKTCELFSPHDLPAMYPFAVGGANPALNCSQVDIDAPDPGRFPAFGSAPRWEARLEPGDLLFIPVNWFHAFRHHGELNANMNYWWKPERAVLDPVAVRQAMAGRAGRVLQGA